MSSKTRLEVLSEQQEAALKKELDRVADRGTAVVSRALLVVGGLVLSYVVLESIFKKNKPLQKKQVKETSGDINSGQIQDSVIKSFFSEIAEELAREAMLTLLGIAKQKLTSYYNVKNRTVRETGGAEKQRP